MKALPYLILIILLILPLIVSAATIHGSVYDFSLNKLKNIVIEVNSQPIQRVVSRDGNYKFSLSQGNYIVSAKINHNISIAEEKFIINSDGDFNIDLFISPDISESELIDNINGEYVPDISLDEKSNSWNFFYITIGLLIIISLIFFHFKKKNNKTKMANEDNSSDSLPEKVLEIIKNEGGRITQKDLRKHFPLSEAKISLVISELESKGKVEKIKKGRGNIIVLKN